MLCLQYDDKVIISGSSDSTVRVWDVDRKSFLNTINNFAWDKLNIPTLKGGGIAPSLVKLG